jgi:DNA-directed RNA polymerase subunit M/transcription elongation factor TFIIS
MNDLDALDALSDETSTHSPAVYVFAERPRCPNCYSARLLAYKTVRSTDDSITRRCRCACCGQRIDVVWE